MLTATFFKKQIYLSKITAMLLVFASTGINAIPDEQASSIDLSTQFNFDYLATADKTQTDTIVLPELGTQPNTLESNPKTEDKLLQSALAHTASLAQQITQTLAQHQDQQYTDTTGNALVQKQLEDYAVSQIQSEINQQINQHASDFLGKFGKAEVNLSIDKNGHLQQNAISLFSPLYDDKQTHLFFSQLGFHQQGHGFDKRNIGNFGLGYRYSTPEWLAGANVFFDHDFDGHNSRLGIGGELWMDYLKLATNYYMPLTQWQESSVMKDYETLIYDERPARGYDIRAQAYLPSYPQLGGSLVFEQYFGNEVALFSTQDRQQDPMALTLGLDYTPVPLFTAKLSHKIGEGGRDDSRLDLAMNLQIGTSLEAQLDPENVNVARSLMGSRYDKVDRNYDIVFEYRQEAFQLKLALNPAYDKALEPDNYSTSDLFTTTLASRSPIVDYQWIVSSPAGTVRNYPNQQALISLNSPGRYDVALEVTTQNGHVARSNSVQLNIGLTSGAIRSVQTRAFPLTDISQLSLIDQVERKYLLIYEFSVDPSMIGTQSLADSGNLPVVYWRTDSSHCAKAWCEFDLSHYPFINGEVIPVNETTWQIYVIGNYELVNEKLHFYAEWRHNGKVFQSISLPDEFGLFESSGTQIEGELNVNIVRQQPTMEGEIAVNDLLEAEITLPDGSAITSDMLRTGRLDWVLYRRVPNTQCDFADLEQRRNPNCFFRANYYAGDGNQTTSGKPRVENIIANGKLIRTQFHTQEVNQDALLALQQNAPNFSEQGYFVEIHFNRSP